MNEIISRRALNYKLFDTGRTKPLEGNLNVPIYGVKIKNGLHYKKNGQYLDINTTVKVKTKYEFTHEVDEARAILRFGDNSGNQKSHLFGIEDDEGNWLNCKLHKDGHHMSGVINNKPTFPQDGLTVEHIPKYNGVKTNYWLGSSGVNELTVTFKYNNELTPEQRGNTIVFLRDGIVKFKVNEPYAYDAADSEKVVEPVSMVLGETGSFKSATLTVDAGWAISAVDPVIDPDVTIDDSSGTFQDNFLSGNPGNEHKNYGQFTTYNGAWLATATNLGTSLQKVDLTGFSNITVTTARIGIDMYSLPAGAYNIKVYKVLKSWVEGTGTGTAAIAGESDWLDQSHGSTTWASAGCQGSGTDHAVTEESTYTTAINSDLQITLTNATVQEWVDTPANNNGVVHISTETVPAGNSAAWYPSESVIGNIPYFYMEFFSLSINASRRNLLLLLRS